MTGPRRDGGGPNRRFGDGDPGSGDPAYAEQAPYGANHPTPAGPAPTQRLPQYPYGYDPATPYATGRHQPTGPGEPPPDGPSSPRWLWIVAGVAALVVVGLVIALVISNSSRQQTVVAPAPAMPEPTMSTTTRTPTTTNRTPSPSPSAGVPVPAPDPTGGPATTTTTGVPGQTETVTYDVSGAGRAISITYTDSGGVPQTEFNVALPWNRQVELPSPAQGSARISIINLGAQVSCTVTIDGVTTEQRTGAGLTICAGLG